MSLCSLLLRRDSRLVVLGEGATVPWLWHGLAALGAAGTMQAGFPVAKVFVQGGRGSSQQPGSLAEHPCPRWRDLVALNLRAPQELPCCGLCGWARLGERRGRIASSRDKPPPGPGPRDGCTLSSHGLDSVSVSRQCFSPCSLQAVEEAHFCTSLSTSFSLFLSLSSQQFELPSFPSDCVWVLVLSVSGAGIRRWQTRGSSGLSPTIEGTGPGTLGGPPLRPQPQQPLRRWHLLSPSCSTTPSRPGSPDPQLGEGRESGRAVTAVLGPKNVP